MEKLATITFHFTLTGQGMEFLSKEEMFMNAIVYESDYHLTNVKIMTTGLQRVFTGPADKRRQVEQLIKGALLVWVKKGYIKENFEIITKILKNKPEESKETPLVLEEWM